MLCSSCDHADSNSKQIAAVEQIVMVVHVYIATVVQSAAIADGGFAKATYVQIAVSLKKVSVAQIHVAATVQISAVVQQIVVIMHIASVLRLSVVLQIATLLQTDSCGCADSSDCIDTSDCVLNNSCAYSSPCWWWLFI